MLNSVNVDSTAVNGVGSADQWGNLSTVNMFVGAGHNGQYVLHSGTNFVQNTLTIGQIQGGNGLYEMTGGTLTSTNTVLGSSSGNGLFRQNVGVHNTGTLVLGMNTVANGTYIMNGGTLIANATMKVGDKSGGTFNMSGGYVQTGSIQVGVQGASNGLFIQDGGFSKIDALNKVVIGAATFATGTYSLNFGTLTSDAIVVGDAGFGTMLVGGSLATQQILIGNTPGAVGYLGVGGNIVSNYTMVSNLGATGTVRQTGGSFFSTQMDVGQHLGSGGKYEMWGGFLNSPTLNIGANNGGARFEQMNGTVQSNGTVTIGTNARYTMSGGTLLVNNLTNTGSFTATGGFGSFGTVTNGAGSMQISGNANFTANNFRQRTVGINGGTLSIRDRAQGGQGARLESIGFNFSEQNKPMGAFDVADTGVMFNTMSNGAVIDLVRAGRNNGSWNGTGITSHNARNTAGTTLGILTGQQYRDIYGQAASFGGHVVVNTDILVKYTLYGDTDFNGVVNFDDYSRTDNGFNNHNTDWFHGDFDLNGVVNFDDYALLDRSFNLQNGAGVVAGVGTHAVPEASTTAIALIAGIAMTMRRRRGGK
jgi:hypothetical protein